MDWKGANWADVSDTSCRDAGDKALIAKHVFSTTLLHLPTIL